MSEKEFKTYSELLSILSSRGIDLSTSEARGYAKKALQHEGYYNLINGYKEPFLKRDSGGNILSPEEYVSGTTVKEIRALCSFDRSLRGIFLKDILSIETNVKALISYAFSEAHGHKNYLIYTNFDTSKKDAIKKITALLSEIQKQISGRVSDPSINHYLTKYGYIPIWVLNNILTLGTVSKYYSLMKQHERQSVSKVFRVTDEMLENILLYLSSVRNICAHSNRLYCYRTKRVLIDLSAHTEVGIPKNASGEYEYGKRDLFAVLLIFKTMLPKSSLRLTVNQIDKALNQLKKTLNVLSENDVLEYMGFPKTWKEDILK